MSSEASSINFSPMVDTLRQGLDRYLPQSSQRARSILESSAIVQISFTSLKNAPHALLKREFDFLAMTHGLSSRLNYLEGTSVSLVLLVHNLFFGALYAVLVFLTLGLSRDLNLRCRMHWAHATYSLVAVGIGACGVLSPYLGVGLNVKFVMSIVKGTQKGYRQDLNHFERPLLQWIKNVTKDWSPLIHRYVRAVTSVESRYKNYYEPSLWHVEKKIHAAKRMDDLMELLDEIRRNWNKETGLLENPKSERLNPSL